MIYILTYKIGAGESKLAQIEADGFNEAKNKVEGILKELDIIRRRKHYLIDIEALNGIRKLDSLD